MSGSGRVQSVVTASASGLATAPSAVRAGLRAGAYSLLQPELVVELRDRRLGHLQASAPTRFSRPTSAESRISKVAPIRA